MMTMGQRTFDHFEYNTDLQQPVIGKLRRRKERKEKEDRIFNYTKPSDWIFDERDWKRAVEIREHERIYSLTSETAFQSLVFSILSQKEKYSKQVSMYSKLKVAGFLEPRKIIDEPIRFSKIMKKSSLSEDKIGYLTSLSEFWTSSNGSYFKRVKKDLKSDQSNGDQLRDEIVKNVKGVAYKTASLAFLKYGYEDFFSLDIWHLRYAKSQDVFEKIGLKNETVLRRLEIPQNRYKKVEAELGKIAKEYDESLENYKVTNAVMDACIWGKYANWTPKAKEGYRNNYSCNIFSHNTEK